MPPEVTTRLPREPASIAAARRALEPVDPGVDDETLATLKLLVSELVHQQRPSRQLERRERDRAEIELSVSASPAAVRVDVIDPGPGFEPRARVDGQDKGSGWGLHLVEAMSDRWGTERRAGTRVWFEIDFE